MKDKDSNQNLGSERHIPAQTHDARLERMSDQARSDHADAMLAEARRVRALREERSARNRHSVAEETDAYEDDYEPPRPRHRPHGRPREHMSRFERKLILLAIVLCLLIVAILVIWPRVKTTFSGVMTPVFSVSVPDSLNAMLPDEELGYNSIDFSNAILGESRERKELVVMEQDVTVTSQISENLLNLAIFSKMKVITSYGTGVYTVQLNGLSGEDIVLDGETKIITVTIPHTTLGYVDVDVSKTELEDTQKAMLAIGDIKLTAEQKQLLDQSIDEALHERLTDPALFIKADEIALTKVRELFQPAVTALSPDFVVKIVMPPIA